jgi:SAM-dependent methyltransferase
MPGVGTASAHPGSGPAFDRLADRYDASFTHTWLGRTLRRRVWDTLDRSCRAPDRILELGCGTGEDALRLADRGVNVTATDISPRMVEVARAKAALRERPGHVDFRRASMEELDNALEGQRFDGVLANFGVVNCARDLPALVDSVAARLVADAPLVWVVMGPYAPWEWAWYLPRGDWQRATRRLRRDGVTWNGLTVRYPSPARMRELLQPRFAVHRIVPLGVVLPPSYAGGWLERAPRTRAVLAGIDRLAGSLPPLAWIADHYIVEARRLSAERR